MHIYGLNGEWDALAALIEYGTGERLTDADKAAMFAAGYMNDDYTPTPAAHKAREGQKTGDDLYIGGRVTVGNHHQPVMSAIGYTMADDPRLSEVVNLGHGGGPIQPRFPAEKPVTYHTNDSDFPDQMQGSIPRIDCGMDTIMPPRKGRPSQAS